MTVDELLKLLTEKAKQGKGSLPVSVSLASSEYGSGVDTVQSGEAGCWNGDEYDSPTPTVVLVLTETCPFQFA